MEFDEYCESLDDVSALSYLCLFSPSSESFTTPSETEVMSLTGSTNSPGSHYSGHAFTEEEDELLRNVASEMDFDWPRIARLLEGKTPAQVAKRWTSKLDPNIKKSRWTAAEDRHIDQLQAIHGNNWKLIAKELPGRPASAIKSRYYNAIRKRSARVDSVGLDSEKRQIQQMNIFPVNSTPVLESTVMDKEARVTALRKQLAGLELLMGEKKAEMEKLRGKPKAEF